jgi:hypothetical protein
MRNTSRRPSIETAPEWAHEAIKQWIAERGNTWKDDLHSAWITGNYRGVAPQVAGTLQSFRNTTGIDWLSQ